MLKALSLVVLSFGLCCCDLLPGMQNLNTYSMQKAVVPNHIEVHPTLIPITPSLIADQHINTYFYRVAPADVLSISVWDHPEFNLISGQIGGMKDARSAGQATYLVNAKGQIYFPLIGYIDVVDKTVDRIRADVTERLKKFVPNPQINVQVAEFRGRKVYVLGEVKVSGFLPINDQQLTIADALALSGWIDPYAADPRFIYVIRGDFICPKIYWLNAKTPDRLLLAERFSLQPRDILYVSSAPATRMNRVLDQLLPVVQTVWFTKNVIHS